MEQQLVRFKAEDGLIYEGYIEDKKEVKEPLPDGRTRVHGYLIFISKDMSALTIKKFSCIFPKNAIIPPIEEIHCI